MMTIFAPNLFVRRGGGEAKGEEEVAGRRREFRRQAQTLPQVQLSQGCRMRGAGENMDGGVRHQVTGGAEGARDQPYTLTIGMEGVTKNSML